MNAFAELREHCLANPQLEPSDLDRLISMPGGYRVGMSVNH